MYANTNEVRLLVLPILRVMMMAHLNRHAAPHAGMHHNENWQAKVMLS